MFGRSIAILGSMQKKAVGGILCHTDAQKAIGLIFLLVADQLLNFHRSIPKLTFNPGLETSRCLTSHTE